MLTLLNFHPGLHAIIIFTCDLGYILYLARGIKWA
jgi:hypothetical protein